MEITPPIQASLFKDIIAFGTVDDEYFVHVKDTPGDEDVQIVNGQIAVVGNLPGTSHVDFAFEESVKAYDFDEQVKNLIDIAKKHGYTVNGAFDGDGEESGDFWRVDIENNVVTQMRGVITFPNDRYRTLIEIGRGAMNHGWVIPRKDGAFAKCGGPAFCPDCKADRALFVKELYR